MINLKQIVLSFFKPQTKEKNDYLQKLIYNLEEVKNSNAVIPFTIQRLKSKGFLIKVGGLFGFVSFGQMPWQYITQTNWQCVAPFLSGQKFYCSIYSIQANPILIVVDGKAHKFAQVNLQEGILYKAIIIQKTNYGLFLEVGYHFNWKYGSIIGLAHKTTFLDTYQYENSKKGDTTETYFHGYNADNKPIFGESVNNIDFLTGKLQDYIGTIKEVTVKKTGDDRQEYLVEDKYPATLSVTKTVYPNNKKAIKNVVLHFQDNEKIHCHIIGIGKKNNKFQLKLTDQYGTTKI